MTIPNRKIYIKYYFIHPIIQGKIENRSGEEIAENIVKEMNETFGEKSHWLEYE